METCYTKKCIYNLTDFSKTFCSLNVQKIMVEIVKKKILFRKKSV